jgi:hypothetical protein
MSNISLRLPESLHSQARALAEQEGISIKRIARQFQAPIFTHPRFERLEMGEDE